MAVIEKSSVRIVYRAPSSKLKTSYGDPQTAKAHVLVSLTDSDGVTGWGEATPLPKFNGMTASMIALALEQEFLPLLKGREAGDIAGIMAALDAHLPGNTDAKCAVDTALHDLRAKELGVPEYDLLGGRCRESVMLNRHIGICSVEESAASAQKYAAQGYKSIKMKIGLDPDEDIRRVRAVRRALGDLPLRLDANQGYSFAEALRVLRAIEDCNVLFCEQPLAKGDLKGFRALHDQVSVPLAADESLTDLESALRLAEARCVDYFTIKLIKCGGLFMARQIAAVAEAAGIRCVVTSTFDTQLGAAHCLHLASSLANAPVACDLTCFASQQDQGVSAHTLQDGALSAGSAPGCGVFSIDEANLQPQS